VTRRARYRRALRRRAAREAERRRRALWDSYINAPDHATARRFLLLIMLETTA
jgi:hypothetical protein